MLLLTKSLLYNSIILINTFKLASGVIMDKSIIKFWQGLIMLGKILTALKVLALVTIIGLIIWWLAR